MKKVLVTGGNGFIGSNFIRFLLKKNFYVINIDNNKYTKNSYLLKNLKSSNYFFYKTDINNKKRVYYILKKYKPTVIFNLAAETHVDRSIESPKDFIHSNINGIFNLLEAIRNYKRNLKKKVRLVHISTDEVYGDIKKNDKSKENSIYAPSSPYAASKASADHLVKSYVRTYKLDACITNCSNNYGPGQFPEKLIPTMIYNIINNRNLPVYGKGKNSREWIHVNDHCEGLIKVWKKGKTGENYNIGTGFNTNNLNLTKLLIRIAKDQKIKIGKNVKIKFVKDRPGHDLRYALDSYKIRKKLKWKPSISFKKGLTSTFNWYYENQKFFKTFSKNNFFKRLGLRND